MSYFNKHFKVPSDLKKNKEKKQKQKYSYTDNLRTLISMFIKCAITYKVLKENLTFTRFSFFPEVKTIVTYIFIFL